MVESKISNKFINATKWASITQVAVKLVKPITTMILARLITPEAFGIVATVTMILSFADMLTTAGFQIYLVQHEFSNKKQLYNYSNVAFWTNFAISVIFWLVVTIFRNSIARIIGTEGMGWLISVACIQVIITSLSSIQMALLKRELNFKAIFFVQIIAVLVPFIVTIPLAYLGFSYWSVILGSIITEIVYVCMSMIYSEWRPNFYFQLKYLREMFTFSAWTLFGSIAIWFSNWIDIFVIGTFMSQYYLGLYKSSLGIVNSLNSLIIGTIAGVLLSTLSRMQNDNESFNTLFLKTQKIVSIFILPLGVGTFLYRDLVTRILLGTQWKEASVVIGIWALTSSIVVLFNDISSIAYNSKGKPKIVLTTQILYLIILLPTIFIASNFSFTQFVYIRSLISLIQVLIHTYFIVRVFKIPVKVIFLNQIPAVTCSFLMAIFIFYFNKIYNNMFWNFISIILSTIFYFIVLYNYPGQKKELKEFLSSIFNKKLNRKENL